MNPSGNVGSTTWVGIEPLNREAIQTEALKRFDARWQQLVDAIGPEGVEQAIVRLRGRLVLIDRAIEAVKSYETVNGVSPDSKCSE
jgi:hypothetical protein